MFQIERLKAQSTENELLKKELKNVRVKLEEEQTCRSIKKSIKIAKISFGFKK